VKRLVLFAVLAAAALGFAVPAALSAGPAGPQQCTNANQVVLVYNGTHNWVLNITYTKPGTTFSGTASDDAPSASGTVTGTFSASTMSFVVTYVYNSVTYVWQVDGLPISGGTATSSSQNGVTFPQGSTTMQPGVEACAGAINAPEAARPEPARIAYCSVPGNNLPNGTPLAPGTFLDLLSGQPETDAHYTGATPAFWVEGTGLTCSLPPTQGALAASSSVFVGGGGTPLPAGLGGYYMFIPSK